MSDTEPSEAQVKHVVHLNEVFTDVNFRKYIAGASEHKGNLWEVDILALLYNIRDEAMDTFNYVQSAIDEIEAK